LAGALVAEVIVMRTIVIVSLVVALGCQAESLHHSSQSLAMPCEDTACQAPPDAPPPPPPTLDCTDTGTPLDKLILAGKMLAAANCVGVDAGKMNGYGCFCGSGNTGLDTKPVDALDACCQQHDVDWYAICQSTPSQPGSTTGCNCYKSTPTLSCNDGVLELPEGLDDDCQRACGKELIKNNNCMAQHKEGWDPEYWPGRPGDVTPFDGPCPGYCKKGGPPLGSDFGGVVLPDDELYPTCEPVAEDMPATMLHR
jgi:hypothetical protein